MHSSLLVLLSYVLTALATSGSTGNFSLLFDNVKAWSPSSSDQKINALLLTSSNESINTGPRLPLPVKFAQRLLQINSNDVVEAKAEIGKTLIISVFGIAKAYVLKEGVIFTVTKETELKLEETPSGSIILLASKSMGLDQLRQLFLTYNSDPALNNSNSDLSSSEYANLRKRYRQAIIKYGEKHLGFTFILARIK